MKTKKFKLAKKPAVKTIAAKSKKPAKTSKAKVVLARININIPKSLHNKTKKIALKSKTTIQAILISAIKEYINKPDISKTNSNTESAS